jgi:protein ImuB
MFAALHVPDFPVAAALRNQRGLRDLPCAVLAAEVEDDAKGKLPIAAANRAARFAGAHPGWPLNRALVRCPGLRVLPRDPQAEEALTAELIDLGETLTPDLELTAPDMATLDLSGLRFPPEDLFSAAVLPEVELWTSIAETPDLAGLAARCESTRGRVIRPEDLVGSPLSVLHLLAAGDPALGISWRCPARR